MSKEKTPQTIESLQMANMKVTNRYKTAIIALVVGIVCWIGSYFVTINLVTDTQAKAVNVLTSKANQ